MLLGWAEAGFANLYSRKPVRSMDALRATKVWLRSGDPVIERVLHELQIQPVPVALSDVLTSLQTGLLETVYVSPLALLALQWHPHVSYAFHTPIFNIQAGLVVDVETFAKLSEADQETVRRICSEHIGDLVGETRRENAEAVEVLREKGVQFLEPTAEHVREAEEMRGRIAAALTGPFFDEALLKRFEELLAEARRGGGEGQ